MKMRTQAGYIEVGDYMTTSKRGDVWWKVLEIVQDAPGQVGNVYRFRVVNSRGYQKEIIEHAGTNLRLYRWV